MTNTNKDEAQMKPKLVPFSSIFVPEEENARTKLTKVDELAKSIDTHGLLQNLVVTPNISGDAPYRLVNGFRRAAALKMLNWGDKEVPVRIVPAQDRLIKNLVENLDREDLHPADLAQRLHDLETGEYDGEFDRDEEGKAKKYTKRELVELTGKSLSHVTNLIRARKVLIKPAWKLWNQKNVPITTVFAWAAMDEDEQEKAVNKYIAQMEKQAASKDEKGGKKGAKGSSSEDSDEPKKYVTKKKDEILLEGYAELYQWQLAEGRVKGKEAEIVKARAEVLLYVLGKAKTKMPPGINQREHRAFEKATAPEPDAAEEAEEATA